MNLNISLLSLALANVILSAAKDRLPGVDPANVILSAAKDLADTPQPVILSAAKDLVPGASEILRCAQDDRLGGVLVVLNSSGSLAVVWLSQARISSLSWPSAGGGSLWRGGVRENEMG